MVPDYVLGKLLFRLYILDTFSKGKYVVAKKPAIVCTCYKCYAMIQHGISVRNSDDFPAIEARVRYHCAVEINKVRSEWELKPLPFNDIDIFRKERDSDYDEFGKPLYETEPRENDTNTA